MTMSILNTNLSLQDDFAQSQDPQWFIYENYPFELEIPKDREPEFGILLERMETAAKIEETLRYNPQIRQLGEHIPHNGLLISLPQDTVDPNGLPSRQVESIGLENRRRFNFVAHNRKIIRFDISFKSRGKTDNRKEYEAASIGLNDGLTKTSIKAVNDYPDLRLIDKNSYRVLGTCLAARSSSYFIYMLSDNSACVKIEANDDACAIATPHVDTLLGYRKEKEFEITSIHLKNGDNIDSSHTNSILDQAISELKEIVFNDSYDDNIHLATESKGAHTVNLINAHYLDESLRYKEYCGRDFDGIDVALLQNVNAETFLGKASQMALLAKTIPSSFMLGNATIKTKYDKFFPTRTDSPKNPAVDKLSVIRPHQQLILKI